MDWMTGLLSNTPEMKRCRAICFLNTVLRLPIQRRQELYKYLKFNTEINRTIYSPRRSNETEENEKSHILFETRNLRLLAFTELYKTPQVMVLPSHCLNSLASSSIFQAFSSVQCGANYSEKGKNQEEKYFLQPTPGQG